MNKRKKAVVTGGCGFIGSHIAERLLADGYEVAVVDDLSSGKTENISRLPGKVDLLEGDIRDSDLLRKAFRGAEVIFHQAAFISVPGSEESPAECFDVNVGGTLKVLAEAERENVGKIVFASSCAVYGNEQVFPIGEDSPVAPNSPYALSKLTAEKLMNEYCLRKSMGITALRYFNVYGPRQNPDSKYAAVVSRFIKDGVTGGVLTVEGDGRQTRDFVFVGDVAAANMSAAGSSTRGFDVFNVCSGTEASVIELAETVSVLLEGTSINHAAPRANDIMRSWGSNEKASKTLGFNACTGLKEGLKATIESFRKGSTA